MEKNFRPKLKGRLQGVLFALAAAGLVGCTQSNEAPFGVLELTTPSTQEKMAAEVSAVAPEAEAAHEAAQIAEEVTAALNEGEAKAVVSAADEAVAEAPKGPNFEKIKQQAEAGDLDAKFELAMLHLVGNAGAKQDRGLAISLLEELASQGHSRALLNLGNLMMGGENNSRRDALLVYEKGAEQGDLDSMRYAAFLLAYEEDGFTLVKDKTQIERAKKYLEDAAGKGDVFAEASLGVLLADSGDLEGALPLLKKSAFDGVAQALDKLETIAESNPSLLDKASRDRLKAIQGKRERG